MIIRKQFLKGLDFACQLIDSAINYEMDKSREDEITFLQVKLRIPFVLSIDERTEIRKKYRQIFGIVEIYPEDARSLKLCETPGTVIILRY